MVVALVRRARVMPARAILNNEKKPMTLPRRSPAALAASLALFCAFPLIADAQHDAPYPSRPLRIVVPVAPGGGIDIIARVIAPRLNEALGQSVIVENRSGGAMVIGTTYAAKAPPDGHTLIANNSSLAFNATLYSKLPYDTLKDLAPVSLLVKQPSIVVVHPSLPVQSIAQLVALARSRPGQLAYGSGGSGTSIHLAAALLAISAKLDLLHVPYKGAAPVLVDLVGGQIQMAIPTLAPTLPFVTSKRLKALAVTGSTRAAAVPQLPTVAEAGLPGYEFVTWYALSAPGGTPARIVERLNTALAKILGTPEVRRTLTAQGFEPTPSTAEEYGAYLKAEVAKWARVIRVAKIEVE
jgi:tripartite-type tricarboxylate transporter receptor subunit TctC